MNDALLLYIPHVVLSDAQALDTDTVECYWRVPVPEGADSDEYWEWGKLSRAADQLAPLQDIYDLTVLIPSVHGLLTKLEVNSKQRRHLQQVLPFMVEEKLAVDVEAMHFATASISNSELTVAAVQRDWLKQLLQSLKSLNLTPQQLLFDVDLLSPYIFFQASYVLWLNQHHALLLNDGYQAASFERSQSQLLFQLLQQQDMSKLVVLADADNLTPEEKLALEQLQASSDTHIEFHPTGQAPVSRELCEHIAPSKSGKPLRNLLQGIFSPPRQKHKSPLSWKPIAITAALLLVANLGYCISSGLFLNHKAEQKRAASQKLYREYFPKDKKIIDIRKQTTTHLKTSQSSNSSGFITALHQVLPAWQQNSANQPFIKSLRYKQENQEILLDLETRSIDLLDKLQQQLEAAGINAELLSATEEDKGVRGRLKLTGVQ